MSGNKTFFNISENMPTDQTLEKAFLRKQEIVFKKDKAMLHVISKKISLSFILDSDIAFITRSAGSTFHRLTWTGTIVSRGFPDQETHVQMLLPSPACPVGN